MYREGIIGSQMENTFYSFLPTLSMQKIDHRAVDFWGGSIEFSERLRMEDSNDHSAETSKTDCFIERHHILDIFRKF